MVTHFVILRRENRDPDEVQGCNLIYVFLINLANLALIYYSPLIK